MCAEPPTAPISQPREKAISPSGRANQRSDGARESDACLTRFLPRSQREMCVVRSLGDFLPRSQREMCLVRSLGDRRDFASDFPAPDFLPFLPVRSPQTASEEGGLAPARCWRTARCQRVHRREQQEREARGPCHAQTSTVKTGENRASWQLSQVLKRLETVINGNPSRARSIAGSDRGLLTQEALKCTSTARHDVGVKFGYMYM